jgi:hypothetical protein
MIFAQEEELKLSGILYVDSKTSFDNVLVNNVDNSNLAMNEAKSPLLGAALSFAVPGLGEFYSKSYIKAAAFFAIEVAAITVGLIYDKKGDDQTNVFQNYANEHWSVQRYAKWTVTNAKNINTNINPDDYNVFTNTGSVNWNELNRLETDLGSYYSHRLAYKGEQQYYEMIGKYHQFNPGWDDFGDENTPYVYGDPLTEKFLFYAKQRGEANDFYNIASKAVIVIVANHFISALDAAWSASRFNKNLELSSELKKFDMGFDTYYYPQFNLRYRF